MGIHTVVFNKSYIWTTLADHITRTDEEIIRLCGYVPSHRNKKTTCRDGRSTDQKKGHGCGRGRGKPANSSNERKRSHTLSEQHSQNYGISPPSCNTRTLRSGLQLVDYVSLNDGFDDKPTADSRKRKRITH